jgi:two-component system OmpR family sensor kinase
MRSLRGRLFGGIALAVLVSVSATLLLAAYLLDRSLSHGALVSLGRQADLVAKGGLRPTTHKLGLFLATQQERLAVLPTKQARLLLPDAKSLPAQGTVTVNRTRYLYAARKSGRRNVVVLLRSAKLASADRRPLVLALVAAGGLGAGLAALLAALLARGIAEPVRRVADAARSLAAGSVPEPLPATGSEELRTLSRTFNEMAGELARAREAERAFLLSVSHELKTPLTAIRGYAEALEEGVLAPDEAVRVIHTEAARLERLVSDLLELARLNRLDFEVKRVELDLAEVAREAVARHALRARDLEVEIAVDAPAPAPAEADPDRVAQVVSNLVENALRCTPPGGTVTIAAAPGTIAVADTGPGIGADELPHAFDRFFLYRRYASERPVGTGLGLSIVRDLARAMGGEVAVESGAAGGTRFSVHLPTRPAVSFGADGGARPAARSRPRRAASAAASRKPS